jgi:hypothetical protein
MAYRSQDSIYKNQIHQCIGKSHIHECICESLDPRLRMQESYPLRHLRKSNPLMDVRRKPESVVGSEKSCDAGPPKPAHDRSILRKSKSHSLRSQSTQLLNSKPKILEWTENQNTLVAFKRAQIH